MSDLLCTVIIYTWNNMSWKENVRAASRSLNLVNAGTINEVLNDLAASAEAATDGLLAANALDLAAMDRSNPRYDRL